MNKTNTNDISCLYSKSSKDKLIDSSFITNIFNVYLNESLLSEENNIMYITNSTSFNLRYCVKDGITILPSMIFSNVEKLNSIKLPNNYRKIANKAFYGASSLSSIIMNNVESIGSYAFDGCIKLKEINLENIKDLFDYSLAGCGIKTVKLLKDVEDPNDFMTIYNGLFKDCKNLKEYKDTENDYYIGVSSFAGCTSLETVEIQNYLGIAGKKVEQDCYLIGSEEIYEGDEVIEENTDNPTTLPDYVFAACSNLKNVSFLDAIENIGIGSLMFCSKLTNINGSIKKVDKYGLKNCVKLKDINLSECDTINEYGLQNCNSIKTIDISSLVNVEDGVFDSCDSLTTVSNCNLSEIPNYMFRNCKNLNTIEGFENIVTVGDEAFMNCQSLLPSLDLSNITTFGDYAFANCKLFSSITLNENAILGKATFSGCENIREIELPASISNLPVDLLKDCKSLKKIVINYHDDSDFNLSALANCNNINYIEIVDSERYTTPNNNCIYDTVNEEIIYVCKDINLFEINLEDYSENVSIANGAFDNCMCNIIFIKDVKAPNINANTFKNIKYKNYHVLINKNDERYSLYYKLLGKKHIYSYIVDQEVNDDGSSSQTSDDENNNSI